MQAIQSPLRVVRIIERAPLGAAAVLITVYIALHLAVAAVVYVLTPADPVPSLARQDAPAPVDGTAAGEHDHAQAH